MPSRRGQRMKLKMKFGIWALTRSLAQLQFFAAEVRYRRVRDESAGHTKLILRLPDTAFKNEQPIADCILLYPSSYIELAKSRRVLECSWLFGTFKQLNISPYILILVDYEGTKHKGHSGRAKAGPVDPWESREHGPTK